MATIRKVVVTWSGLSGLPGYSVFYGTAAMTDVSPIANFFGSFDQYFPSNLAWSVPSGGDEIDDATGTLLGDWAGTGAAVVTGTGGGAADHASGVGGMVQWRTAAVVGGRRLRGRTFLTHMISSAYDNGGNIDTAALTAFSTGANLVVAAGEFVVWHRPQGGSGGSSAVMSGSAIPDRVSWLRTRRD